MHRRSLTESQKFLRCRTGDLFCRNASSHTVLENRHLEKKRAYDGKQTRGTDRLASATMTMVDRLAKEPLGWKHTNRRAEKQNIRAKLVTPSAERAPTTEKSKFDMYDAEAGPAESEVSTSEVLAPGTFVETRRNLTTGHGIILGQTTVARNMRYCVLMSSGEIWWPAAHDVQFSVPDVVPYEYIQRCGSTDLALVSSKPEINARIELLKHIRDIEKRMEPALHGASSRSVNLYQDVRSQDPDEWERISVSDAALLTKPANCDMYHVFATHKHMMNNPTYFVAGPLYSSNGIFYVRPQSQVDEILQMQTWTRMREEGPIQAFASRARDVIAANQAIHAESANDGPSVSPATHTWTPDDMIILSFLKNSVRRTRSIQSDPYSLGQSAIIKAIRPDEQRIDDHVVHRALIDLGVFAPWQDITMLFPELGIDVEPEETSPRAQRRKELAELGLQKISGNDPIGPNDLHRSDPLEAVRHDFGNLPVYVIDEPHAEELDDGLSVERIPSEPDNLWVHVHIADPASLIPPTHYLATEAARQLETVYLNHRSWPMFPKTLMQDPEFGLSLGARKDKPTNVLTFSAKLNPAGDILDHKVRAGLVRDIKVVSYDQVDAALGATPAPALYPFGGKPKSLQQPPLPASQVEALKDLFTAASYMVKRRYRDGVYNLSMPNIEFVNPSRETMKSTVPILEPTQFRGFPSLFYRAWNCEDSDSGSRGAVAEMAKIASRVSSMFLLEKGIPGIRRFMATPAPFERLDALLNDRTNNGYISYKNPLIYESGAGSAGFSLEAREHFVLGVPKEEGYLRSTSPLRRYLDLVHHWQIHHALLGGSAPKASPPFNEADMAVLIPVVHESARVKSSIGKFHNRFWQVMLMHQHIEGVKRGVEYEAYPLKNLTGTILSNTISNPVTTKFVADVYVEELGMNGVVSLDHADIPMGSSIPVRVEKYFLGTRCRVDFLPA